MEKKPDRRIRRTKAQLRHGLAQLMAEKSVNEVTVKELVDLVLSLIHISPESGRTRPEARAFPTIP